MTLTTHFQILGLMVSKWKLLVNGELEMAWKETGTACLQELQNTTKNLDLNIRTTDQVSNTGPPEYEAEVLTAQP